MRKLILCVLLLCWSVMATAADPYMVVGIGRAMTEVPGNGAWAGAVSEDLTEASFGAGVRVNANLAFEVNYRWFGESNGTDWSADGAPPVCGDCVSTSSTLGLHKDIEWSGFDVSALFSKEIGKVSPFIRTGVFVYDVSSIQVDSVHNVYLRQVQSQSTAQATFASQSYSNRGVRPILGTGLRYGALSLEWSRIAGMPVGSTDKIDIDSVMLSLGVSLK